MRRRLVAVTLATFRPGRGRMGDAGLGRDGRARSVNHGSDRSTTLTVKLSARRYTIFCGIHPTLMHTAFRATSLS